MRRTAVIIPLLLALAIGLGACSDDDDDADAGTVPAAEDDAADDRADGTEDGADDGTAATTVRIVDFAYDPESVEVAVGDTLEIANQDGVGHTLTLDDGSYGSGTIAAGASASQQFDDAGTFPFHCAIHPAMTGTLEVA
jgi:plastocyanin